MAGHKGPLKDYWPNGPHDTEFCEYLRPSVAELVEYLRSDEEIKPRFRSWLADLLSEDADTPMRLTVIARKPGRIPTIEFDKQQNIATHVARRVYGGEKVEAAVADAMKEFNLSRSRVMKIWKEYREALDALSAKHSDPAGEFNNPIDNEMRRRIAEGSTIKASKAGPE
jgi:hypothetical protein